MSTRIKVEVEDVPESPILPGPPTVLAEWVPMRIRNDDGSYRMAMGPLPRRVVDMNPRPAPVPSRCCSCQCQCQEPAPRPRGFIPPRPGQELLVQDHFGLAHDPDLSDLGAGTEPTGLGRAAPVAVPAWLPVQAPDGPGPARRSWAAQTRGPDYQTGTPMGNHLPPIAIAAPRNKYGLYSHLAPGMRYVG